MLQMCDIVVKTVRCHQFNTITYTQTLIYTVILLFIITSGYQRSIVTANKVTSKLITYHNYPVEEHTVYTSDHYILTVYRIRNSPKQQFHSNISKPVVFLQHGILGTSDDWVITGPETSLPYMLSDLGYDVWMGNARGNTYSRRHKHKHPDKSDFWDFSWHEIGVYDLAAMLDYVIEEAKVDSVHFIAHSQGTTTFFVLMSTLPWYNDKVRTVHLLAPIAFLRSHSFLLSKVGVVFLGYPSFLSMIFENFELLPTTTAQQLFCEYFCSTKSAFSFLCSSILHFIGGWGTKQFNNTLLPYVCETHPAGASTTQIIHYLQLYKSGDFKQFDHGIDMNLKIYKSKTPPHYQVGNIRSCVHLYYSDNDYMSAVADVEYLASLLPCVKLYRIPYKDWNHYDFLWSSNVKQVINDRIIEHIQNYEHTNGHLYKLQS